MIFFLLILLLLFSFFILLPVVSICIATIIRFIYRKIMKRKTISTPKFIITVLIFIIGLALIPPIPYVINESLQSDIIITGNIASLTYDDENADIRYIEYNGKKYQELEPSISDVEQYDYSEDTDIKYGKALANVVFENQSFIEKYIYTVFRYPVHSQLIYPIKNDGMSDYLSLEGTYLFCEADTIKERVAYYSDPDNYDYFVVDYNSDEYYDIKIDTAAIEDLSKLAYLQEEYDNDGTEESLENSIPGIVRLEVESDYDLYTVSGESKNNLILKEVGEVYIDKKGRMYQKVEEIWQEDFSVLYVLPISEDASNKLTTSFKNAGIL